MFERMLIPGIENRILVGVVSFVGMMVLLGWAAINEGGRMAALEETFHARAIEQGASLFASNCARCHGADGRGLAGYAPGLNNPQFFGHDLFPEINTQIGQLNVEKVALDAESKLAETTDARKGEITTRLAAIDGEIAGLEIQIESQVAAAANLGYNPARPDRLQNVGWAGTHESYVLTTLIHGRPVSINYWQNGAMPAWSQTAGGPLREDQLEDLVAYVENWDKGDEWTLEDLFAVRQFAIEPKDPAPFELQIQQLTQLVEAGGGELPTAIGTDMAAILTKLEEFTGDAVRGDALYHSQARSFNGTALACSGCHIQATNGTGPMTDGTWARVSEIRVNDPALAGYTPEQYVVESIVLPGNYLVPGFQNLMLPTFAQNLSYQDLADILAYLETLNQPQ